MSTQSETDIVRESHATLLRDHIIEEIIYAFGGKRNGWLQKIAAPLIRIPAGHFGRIVADFYDAVIHLGVSEGARETLPRFNHHTIVRGNENIPTQGPLLIVSNHPGGLDSLGIVSCLPRNDVKVLVTDVKFMHILDYTKRFFIYVSFETIGGMVALRGAIEHLHSGGALLVFAHGDVEPEPECLPGALEAMDDWLPSIEIMLRKVPETRLQIVSTSGAVLSRFLNSPLTHLRKQPERRQKLAEYLQVIQSLLIPRSMPVTLHLSFGKPITTKQMGKGRWMAEIINFAKLQMAEHLNWVNGPARGN